MFNKRSLAPITPLVSAALLTAGCGAQGSSEAPQEDLHGAPSVQNPLDTASFQKEPCKSLSPQQIQTLGLGNVPGEADLESNGGPACDWSNVVSDAPDPMLLSVTYMTQGQGLKQDYAKRNEYPNFKEAPAVDGYPAVMGANNDPIPPEQSGACDISVGISNDLTVTVQTSATTGAVKANSCAKAQQVAGEVVNTVKSGQ